MNQETNIPQEQAPLLPQGPTVEDLGRIATGLDQRDQANNSWQPAWQPEKMALEALPAVATPDKNVPVVEADEDRIPVPVIANIPNAVAEARQTDPSAYTQYPQPRGRHAY